MNNHRGRTLNSRNKRKGTALEDMIVSRLRLMGLRAVEKIGIPTVFANGRLVFSEKVPGDIRAVCPGSGRAVLVECKNYSTVDKDGNARNLPYSALEPHQHRGLQEVHDAGGVALLAWRTKDRVYIVRFPIPGFVPGKSLTPAMAEQYAWDYKEHTCQPN